MVERRSTSLKGYVGAAPREADRRTSGSDIMGDAMTLDPTFRIDAARFWSTVMRSGEIGPGKAGGLRRLTLTDADKEMRDLFVTWCTEAGCTVDSRGPRGVGNIKAPLSVRGIGAPVRCS
jgi:hypothetical protein